ncbi:MAG: Response regulator/GGDEF domain protein [Fibrobacteres bacterium]|nr:Response regulator/GGDEF domain protein [Fibrobacterota bacterium]
MMAFLTAMQIVPALLLCLVGAPMLPVPAISHYEATLMGVLLAEALFFLFLTRSASSQYRIASFTQAVWLFTFAWLSIHLLGGVQFRLNLAIALATAALIGTQAHPVHSVYIILLTIGGAVAVVTNRLYGFLPHTPPSTVQNIPDYVFSIFFPVVSVMLFQAVLLGFKRGNAVTPKPAPAPEAPPVPVPGGANDRPTPKGSVIMSGDGDLVDTSQATQFFNRVYLENQGDQALKDMKDILNTVVYFMSRNFKAYTSLGFLVSELGDKLTLNAVVTKSRNLNYECTIEFGKGVIGSAVNKPAGFITGNLRSYTGELEYYSEQENINSMMIMRVMDNQSKRIQGLLLVDSENMRAFTDEHKELMYRFTQIASAMITSAKLTYQMNKVAIQADLQYEIAKKLSEALKVEEVIDVLTQSLMRTFEHDRLVIIAYNSATAKGAVWRIIGDPGTIAEGMEFDIHDNRSLYGSVFRNRRSVVSQGFRLEQRFVRFDRDEPAEVKPQDILIAPIHDDRQSVWAVIGLESNRAGVYSQTELQLLKTIMANVTTALTKARMYTEMEKLATIDGLTQIANHRKFQDIMTMELERSGRYNTPLTLLLMDIDHFKKFNDTYGHPVGDLVLQMVAKALQGSIRNTDYCARYGGEEFVVVLIQADEAQSRILAERIRKAVESVQIQNDDKILRVTVSIGSATYPFDAANKQELIDNSDKAMYSSKQNGRNRVSFFSEVKLMPSTAQSH